MANSLLQLIRNSFGGLSKEVWLLSLISFINRSGTIVILFMTIFLTQELGFTKLEAGFAMSCFGIGSFAGSYVGGWLTDRYGYYPTMFWSLVIGGLSFFVLMHMTTVISFCTAVLFVSLIGDAFRPANLASLGAYSKPENYNRSLSLIRMAVNLGFAFGSAGAGFLVRFAGYDWLFIIDGITCILAGIFLRFVLADRGNATVSETKEAKTSDTAPAVTTHSAYKDRPYIAFVSMVFIQSVAFMQLFSNFQLYLREAVGLLEDEIGQILFINGVVIFIFEMPLIYVLERRFKRMPMIILGGVMIGVSYLCLNLGGHWLIPVLCYILLISFGEIINFPFMNALALNRANPARRGEFMGLYSMSFSLAFIIAPTLGAYIVEQYSFEVLWYAVGLLSGLSIIGFMMISPYFKDKVMSDDKTSVVPENVAMEMVE